jgi:lipopolysaccharide/colanic/teichoic acid biosynthesis glycosyltransferase
MAARQTRRRTARIAKRLMDLLGATVGLVVLSPVLVLVAVALLVTQGRPILFRHVRPGHRGRPFAILKFRTMRAPRADEVWYLTDDVRMSRLGKFLRSTSLDELPELINVLRGEMSLVGPRPLLMEYLTEYSAEEARRHDVLPGITGWAAVNGRHRLPFRERLRLDVWSVDHWSLGLDVRILWMTVQQVVRRENVDSTEDLSLGFPLPGLIDATAEGDGPADPPSGPDAGSARGGPEPAANGIGAPERDDRRSEDPTGG